MTEFTGNPSFLDDADGDVLFGACASMGDDLHAFSRDELEGAERSAVADHLDTGCPQCSRALESMRAVQSFLDQPQMDCAPPSEELFARIAESLSREEEGTRREENDSRQVATAREIGAREVTPRRADSDRPLRGDEHRGG